MGSATIPEGWRKTTIERCFTFLRTASFSRKNMHLESPNAYYIHYGDIHRAPNRMLDFSQDNIFKLHKDCKITKYDLLTDGDLIVADVSEDYEGIAVSCEIRNLKEKAISGLHTFALRPDTSKISAGYALLLVQNKHTKRHLRIMATGISVLGISKHNISRTPIYIPPLAEQKVIASLLQTWDAAIEKTDALIATKERQFAWLVQILISSQRNNTTWRKYELGDVGRIITGTTPPTKESQYYVNGVYPFVTPTDITSCKIIRHTERCLTEQGMEKGRFIPQGSLLVTCIASIGKNTILAIDGSCNQQINAIVPKQNYDVSYLYYLIGSNSAYMLKFAGKSTKHIINKNTFSKLQFRFPPIQEQKRIAHILNTAQKEIGLLKALAQKYRTQKRGLMQKLLTGIWRV